MELNRLSKYKKKFQPLKSEIDSFQHYLTDLDVRKSGNTILPYVVSEKLHIDEMDAIFLLSLAENEKIVHRVLKVWTNDDEFLLGEFSREADIPLTIYNPATGKEVDRDNFHVDIAFEFENV